MLFRSGTSLVESFRQLGHDIKIFFGDILGFAWIAGEVEKLMLFAHLFVHGLGSQCRVHLILDAWCGESSGEWLSFDDSQGLSWLEADEVMIFDKGTIFIIVIRRNAEVIIESRFEWPWAQWTLPIGSVSKMPFTNRR